MDRHQQMIVVRADQFQELVDEHQKDIELTKQATFLFPNCTKDEIFGAVKNMHMRYAEIIKHNLNNNGYDVDSMEYMDSYDFGCYKSKCVYRF